MIKFIKRGILAVIVVVVAFIAISLTSGGRMFRMFGDTVRDVSYDFGETADLLNQATQDVKSATNTIRKTGRKLKDMASETKEKAAGIVNTTGKLVSDIKNTIGEPGQPREAGEDAAKPSKEARGDDTDKEPQ